MFDYRPPFIVPAPFNTNSDTADIIVRSSDNHDFYAARSILCAASPILAHMFGLPQPPIDVANKEDYLHGKPIISFHEDGQTVLTVLQCCYPDLTPSNNGLWDIYAICLCGDKFGVEKATQLGREALGRFAAGNAPFAAYPIAWKFGFKDLTESIARDAAWNSTYEREMGRIDYEDRSIFKIVDASATDKLFMFNWWCHDFVAGLCDASEWIDRQGGDWHPFWSEVSTGCCAESTVQVMRSPRDEQGEIIGSYGSDIGDPWKVKTWFAVFLAEFQDAVRYKPIKEELTSNRAALRAWNMASTCIKCRERFEGNFTLFQSKLRDAAERAVGRIGFPPY